MTIGVDFVGSVSQMCAEEAPNSLIYSKRVCSSPGHPGCLTQSKTMNTTVEHRFCGLFLVLVFHNCSTEPV